MPSPAWTSMLLRITSIFLALCLVVIAADEGVQQLVSPPSRTFIRRRLFGIRRLKAIHPLVPPSAEHRSSNSVRRHQARNYDIVELPDYVPRAQVPPSFEDRRIAIPHAVEPIVRKPISSESLDEDALKRKKIEARWRRLGINPKTIYYPIRKPKIYENMEFEEEAETFTRIPDIVKATRDRLRSNRIQQLNVEERDRIVRPIHPQSTNRDNINVPSTLNTRKTVPQFYEDKDLGKPRPRIQGPILSAPGEPRPEDHSNEDPSLTPFENNARIRTGFGAASFASLPQPTPAPPAPLPPPSPPTTPAPPPPPPPPPPPTTEAPTASPTTEAPALPGESGAGFGAGPSELPPEFANVGFGIGGSDGNGISFGMDDGDKSPRPKQRKQPNPDLSQGEPLVIPQNSGLRPVAPPKEFGGSGFGSGGGGFGGGSGGFGGGGGGFGGGGGRPPSPPGPSGGDEPSEADFFTGDSALTPSKGPTGDGYGPPVFQGGAAPPPVASVGMGGAAAGKSPYQPLPPPPMEKTNNRPAPVRPSAMLNILNRADQGFNQAITHFEQGTPIENGLLDILEVALGSEKLDSQAKLLGHVDRTIGLDNLQRIQRWANTAGAMEFFKEQFVKLAKNFEPAEDLLPTVPPQFEYLFKRGR